MSEHTDPWSRAARLWPLLAMTRIPGTRRPWRHGELTLIQRDERDAQLRAERHMAEIFLEAQPAPLHLDVLDTLDLLWSVLVRTAMNLGVPMPPQRVMGALDDPRQLLELCRAAARRQPDGVVADHGWAILHTIEAALGEIYDGQKLTADCPWCHGGIARAPSWRVHLLPGQLPAIVCESGACEPPEADAGTWWHGQPAWPLWEWSWLAQRIEADERKAG